MFRSEEPCAIATILMLLAPRLLKSLPLTPVWLFICSPTRATILKSETTVTGCILRVSISSANSRSITAFARCASLVATATHKEYSEEAWVIRMILILSLPMASKKRLANPKRPIIPAPSTVIKEIDSKCVMPLTVVVFLSDERS